MAEEGQMAKNAAPAASAGVAPASNAGDFKLTMPAQPAEALRRAYGGARVILEYGSGGSTFIAAADPARFVMSVESDSAWAERLRLSLAERCPAASVKVHHADIGPTGAWGKPLEKKHFASFHLYATGIWDQPFFRQPDVVLIDGRFRTACFATVLLRSAAPVTVLFDDFADRRHYHWVKDLVPVSELHGRMAVFHIRERPTLPLHALSKIAGAFVDPR